MKRQLIAAAAFALATALTSSAMASTHIHIHKLHHSFGHRLPLVGWHPGWTGSWGHWIDGRVAYMNPGYYTPCYSWWGPCYDATW